MDVTLTDPPPEIYVPIISMSIGMSDPGLPPESAVRKGIYRLPYFDGGYSRDDSGRLRYVWQGEA